jgi:DNA-3-methyladenine glycosylase
MRRLRRSFYARDALVVARELMGCLFVHDTGGHRLVIRLVETEAYRGEQDPGSHGYRGVTPRTEVMFGPPGRLYVYFTYGMHWCANIVCGKQGTCEAVLLRAGEPVLGVEEMTRRRNGLPPRLVAAGPARLTQAMGITKEHNGASLLGDATLCCAEDELTPRHRSSEIVETVRVGLAQGRGDELPWRFAVAGNPFTSRRG